MKCSSFFFFFFSFFFGGGGGGEGGGDCFNVFRDLGAYLFFYSPVKVFRFIALPFVINHIEISPT